MNRKLFYCARLIKKSFMCGKEYGLYSAYEKLEN